MAGPTTASTAAQNACSVAVGMSDGSYSIRDNELVMSDAYLPSDRMVIVLWLLLLVTVTTSRDLLAMVSYPFWSGQHVHSHVRVV